MYGKLVSMWLMGGSAAVVLGYACLEHNTWCLILGIAFSIGAFVRGLEAMDKKPSV